MSQLEASNYNASPEIQAPRDSHSVSDGLSQIQADAYNGDSITEDTPNNVGSASDLGLPEVELFDSRATQDDPAPNQSDDKGHPPGDAPSLPHKGSDESFDGSRTEPAPLGNTGDNERPDGGDASGQPDQERLEKNKSESGCPPVDGPSLPHNEYGSDQPSDGTDTKQAPLGPTGGEELPDGGEI